MLRLERDWGGRSAEIKSVWAGECRKHNFWTACLLSHIKWRFGNLTLRAINWYIFGSNREGVDGWSPGGVFRFLR
jgi:hypothetical protein